MSLQPPQEPQEHLKDPGAHELAAAESSDDHFSDASEGNQPPPLQKGGRNRALSIPVTRVEKVDDEPRHGEVPGTDAYKIRTLDAVPDEIEIVPDGTRSRSTSRVSESDRPLTPGGTPVPKTVVEKIDPAVPGYGDVPGTAAHEMRLADAEPDEVVRAPAENAAPLEPKPSCLTKKASPTPNDRSRSPSLDQKQEPSIIHTVQESLITPSSQNPTTSIESNISNTSAEESAEDFDDDRFTHNNDENEDDGFGDDFDDFEEGAAGHGEADDDFGDFDDGFQQPEETPPAAAAAPSPPQPVAHPLAHLPNLSFADLQTPDDILNAMSPYMSDLFPEFVSQDDRDSAAALPTDPILTDRSASLWSQLVAPPPLQPPNWIRSRIRRLFLVSLGVPVDLDEILPASKQKKLVLPNIHLPQQDPNQKKEGEKKEPTGRKGPAPPPEFDANEATMLAKTTEEAVEGYSDQELKQHVQRLEELIKDASSVLEYWVKRKEDAVGDKEAFEGVIENLVGFVKSRR